MWEELEYEYNNFLEDMKNGENFCRYIDESEYEDEYSHNEIDECQAKFIERIKGWLHENKPSQYVVTSSYCVFVMTKDEAEKRKLLNYEQRIVE